MTRGVSSYHEPTAGQAVPRGDLLLGGDGDDAARGVDGDVELFEKIATEQAVVSGLAHVVGDHHQGRHARLTDLERLDPDALDLGLAGHAGDRAPDAVARQ